VVRGIPRQTDPQPQHAVARADTAIDTNVRRHAKKRRGELTLVQIARHSTISKNLT
jgi:hypothetical protein